MIKRIGVIILTFLAWHFSYAQDYKAELSVNFFVNDITSEFANSDLNISRKASYSYGPKVQVVFNVSPYFLAGAFYGKSSTEWDKGFLEGSDENGQPAKAGVLNISEFYGVTFQFGTSRYYPLCFYGALDIMYMQVADKFHGFDLSTKEYIPGTVSTFRGSAVGGGIGVGAIMKISRVISFKMIELKANFYSAGLSYDGKSASIGLTADTGLSFKFLRKR